MEQFSSSRGSFIVMEQFSSSRIGQEMAGMVFEAL